MKASSKGNSNGLSRRYTTALSKQLSQGPGASLRPAERLGREALAGGFDALDLAKIHARALIVVMSRESTPYAHNGVVKRAAGFFVAALKPLASTHRTALKAHGHLVRRNATLRASAVALSVVRRRLGREIILRRDVQNALEKSEHHYEQLLKRSSRMQEHLRRLSHEILSAHEEERKKISRELHDQIGQTLTAVNVKLATLKREATVNTRGLKKKIASTQRLVERSMKTVHRFARELRPPLLDDLGLIPALRACMKEFTRRTHLPIHFTVFAAVEKVDSDKRTVLYRVVQEALTNVDKHAEATLVRVDIQRRRGDVCLEIHDNGKSFQVERALYAARIRRLGLLGMRERVEMVGGVFGVDSAPGRGTTIRAQIPIGAGRLSLPNARAVSEK